MDDIQRNNFTIAVIGGGAAGMMATAAAAENADCRVLLFDCNDRLGKKIYATGNGRCNLTNLDMRDDCYNQPVLDRIAAFDEASLMTWFRERGVYLHDRNGYVYPRTDQASTIVGMLERELHARENVEIRTHCKVDRISVAERFFMRNASGPIYEVHCRDDVILADRIILATGGLSAKVYGNSRSGYDIACALGHTLTPVAPALVSLQVTDPLLGIAEGVRCSARVTAVVDHQEMASNTGEVQINKSGFSGIPVFQISRYLSLALARGQQAAIGIDFLPEFSEEDLEAEIARRQSDETLIYVRDITAGLVHEKIGSYVAREIDLADEKKLYKLEDQAATITSMLRNLKGRSYPVTGTAGYDKAQVTTGGVTLEEVDADFQSRKMHGLYLCGEVLDVDGICGGYNLTWAMCSGRIAGLAASLSRYSEFAT